MPFSFNSDYFMTTIPNIEYNDSLREPQKHGYYKVYEHFVLKKKTSHALIVLPTGVGKTGLIALLPYQISNGRVLIITPQIVIKDTVIDALNPDHPENFWIKRKVLNSPNDLPNLIEFESNNTPIEVLEAANIVVLNVQKLQSRLDSSPLNFLPEDFFDMIIIDEAHHSTARTWVESIQHFSKAKVVKLTGTPIRTDGKEIAGELVYKYKLSQAMANNYVKSLENFTYLPDELYLTIDGDETKTYTVDEIYKLDLKDEDWVRRSVAYSLECSESVVSKSIELLEKKLQGNSVPHKIIAVASSIEHAQQIETLYTNKGYETTILHSKLTNEQKEKAKSDIKNHRVKVVVHVSMLGEGYDHPYLSIAAIFRPFKNALPYAQFIGRILRTIPFEETKRADDNVGQIVSHKHLGLQELWEEYKKEIQESEIIKHLKEIDIMEEPLPTNTGSEPNPLDIGLAREKGQGTLIGDPYLTTELLKRKKEEDRIREEKIKEIQNLLNINRESALNIYFQAQNESSAIKRPDLYFSQKKKDIDVTIKENIVPELIQKHNIDKDDNNLKDCGLFKNKYFWIPQRIKTNAGMLAVYLINYLNNEIGAKKDAWGIDDYNIAFEKLPEIIEYIDKILEDFQNK